MELSILGPLEVRVNGRLVSLGGAKPRALLAVLLLHRNEPVSAERLAVALWGEDAPPGAVKTVQVHVSRLRKALGDPEALATTPAGYRLRVRAGELDAEEFERLVAEAARADHETAARRLREALALWRGPPLADLAGEAFAQTEIARLEELRLTALEQRIDAELAAGRHADVAGELEALARARPLRERLQRQLMLCLYRCGRQGEALEAYRRARAVLVEELGIEPGRELRELHDAILRQEPGLDLASEPEPADPPPRGAFVGRTQELAQLVAALDDTVRGHGRLFVIAGEPGIGKSRLAEELSAQAVARGARVLVGRCWEAGGAPAYWPWVQSLRAYVRDADDEALRSQLGTGAAALAQIVPELRERFRDLGEPPPLDADSARFRLFDATAEFLRRASRARPIVLVLDDLHAADAASLLLLRFVAREIGSARILLLAAHRDVDPVPAPQLADALAEIAREPLATRLPLGGLSEGELGEYLRLAGAGVASPALASALHEDTEGNPLFVGEFVRLLSVEGAGEDGRLAIPQTVRDVINRRLGHVSPDCARVLALASVFGREFDADTLALLTAAPEEALLATLDEAMAARLVSDVPGAPGRLRFAHVLIRDALYDGLPSARRFRLHRQVVDVIEPRRHGGEPGAHLAELAHHAAAGRDAARTVRYAREAGDLALAHLAYEEAARLYRSALAALHLGAAGDERTRCELLIAIAEAESQAGDTAAARIALREAAGIARRLGLTRELARAAAEYGGRIVYARAGEDDWILPLLEEGLAAVSDDDLELRSSLLARLAGALRDEPSRERRDALSAEAVALARRSGDDAALAYALDGRAIAILAPDTVAEVLAVAEELLEVAGRIRDRERVVHGHMHALGPLLMIGEPQRAEAAVARASRVAADLRQPAHLWDVAGARAMLAVAQGRVGEADDLVEQALALGEHVQPEMVLPVHRMQRYTLCDFRGTLHEVEPAIRELVAAHPSRPVFRCALAHLDARLGRLPGAAHALSVMTADGCEALPFDQEWLLGMSLLAETAHLVGDTGAAGVLYGLLLPWAGLNVVDQCEAMRGSLDRYLGLLATSLRRPDEAAAHFDAAVAMNARMGARPWLALTQADYARMLRDRDAHGDRERARDLAAAALATCRELGIEPAPTAGRARSPR